MNEVDIYQVSKDLATLLPTVDRKLIRPIEHHAKPMLSPMMFHTLAILIENDTYTMTELAKKVGVVKQQLTPIIDKLIDINFVCREYDKADRRIVKIKITPSGIKHLEELDEHAANSIKERIQYLPQNDLLSLQNALANLYEILNKI
jgi:DNA-binding MarR family transcriptional regulator